MRNIFEKKLYPICFFLILMLGSCASTYKNFEGTKPDLEICKVWGGRGYYSVDGKTMKKVDGKYPPDLRLTPGTYEFVVQFVYDSSMAIPGIKGSTLYFTYPKFTDFECEAGKEYTVMTEWDLNKKLVGAHEIQKTYKWIVDRTSGELKWGEKKPTAQ
jgi:hypothetical protein